NSSISTGSSNWRCRLSQECLPSARQRTEQQTAKHGNLFLPVEWGKCTRRWPVFATRARSMSSLNAPSSRPVEDQYVARKRERGRHTPLAASMPDSRRPVRRRPRQGLFPSSCPLAYTWRPIRVDRSRFFRRHVMMTFRAACLSSLLLSLLPEPCSAQRENAVPDPARGYQWDQDAKRRGFDGKDVAQLARDKIIVSNQS